MGLLSAALFYFILLTDNKSEPLIITNGSPVCALAPQAGLEPATS
nr:MAG TPA: hypothetical protein [Caudoviricetes sp.]